MRVNVEYDVPVSALVDTETGKLDKVVVWCEGIDQRDGEYGVVAVNGEMPVGGLVREQAQEIVDSVAWPAWDFG